MTLEKIEIVDSVEVVENNCIQVRICTRIMEDGKQLSSAFHRHVIAPGGDYSAEDAKVQAICAAVHTADVITAYQEAQNAATTAEI